MKQLVSNPKERQRAMDMVEAETLDFGKGKTYLVEVKQHKKDRTLAQNRLAFKWYDELGKKTGHGKEYERNRCKWNIGFQILLTRDDVEPEILKMHQILQSVPYEDRLDAMELVEVTRLFKVNEFAEYLTTVERGAAQAGIVLSRPEDIYNEAIGRYRK